MQPVRSARAPDVVTGGVKTIRAARLGIVPGFLLLLSAGPASGFETAPRITVTEILPPSLVQSLHHRVVEAELNGRYFEFRVESDYGDFNVTSISLLRERIRELIVLGSALGQLAVRNRELSIELQGQLSVSADSAIDILTRPVDTASSLAGQIRDNLDTTLGAAVPSTPGAMREPGAANTDPVTSMHKRNLAAQWELDVYSGNPRVQGFLDTIARERSAGSISAGTPSLYRQPVPPPSIIDEQLEQGIRSLIRNNTAGELLEINDSMLAGMNVPLDKRAAFLGHLAYSPTRITRIVHYLDRLQGVRDRTAFIDSALDAGEESSALAHEDAALMLAYYHHHTGPLLKLHVSNGVLQAVGNRDRMVYLGMTDLLYWSEENARLYTALRAQAEQAGFHQRDLITSGRFSPEARRELEGMDFTLHDHYLD